MVFTQSIPAQAASWRETSAHIIGSKPKDLLNRTPPSLQLFPNGITYTRLRRLHRYGDDAIRKSLRDQPYRRDDLCTTTGQQPPTTTEQVNVNPDYMSQKDKMEMEEFGDLSALLSATVPNVDTTDSTDELNTPVFDKEAFDFTRYTSVKSDENKNDLKVKVEYNAQYYLCDKNIYITDPILATANQVQNKENYSVSKVGKEQTDMYLYPSNVHSLSYKENINDIIYSPPNQSIDCLGKMAAFNKTFVSNLSVNNIKNSNSTATSPQDDRYSYISSPATDQNMDLSPAVPEHYDHLYESKPKLNLMTERFKFPIKQEGQSTLNTPDVIDEVVNMGNNFNILDLVNNEDISIISVDEELLSSLTSPTLLSSEPSTPSTTLSKPSSPVKRTRRRKLSDDDDDDEDYVPPRKKQSTVRLADIDLENSSTSDESCYPPEKRLKKTNFKPRGRPPKRDDSVSSDGWKDQDVSKYRELRDKNNEASRKSRLKRKFKEQEYETEASDLHIKNIRLKAQVEELEKMVSTFRNNLFKILVAK